MSRFTPYTRASRVTVIEPDGTEYEHSAYSGSEFRSVVSNKNPRRVERAVQRRK